MRLAGVVQDITARKQTEAELIAARDAGAAVLLVSAELDEILSLADRVAVMFGGKIVAILEAKEAERVLVGRLMAGLSA